MNVCQSDSIRMPGAGAGGGLHRPVAREDDWSGPPIDPVSEGVDRPFWSVMMPTYNCDPELFEQALRSILDQDPGPDRMQVAVVDDCSSDDRAARIAERLKPGRIEYHRQPRNVGLPRNWNTCLRLSRGRWVHLLHQDDLVLPGFYARIADAAARRPDLGAAFCRHRFIDFDGTPTAIKFDGTWMQFSEPERDEPGVLDRWIERLAVLQRIHCPAIAVRRAAYEQLGGFRHDLAYSLDWEMWSRIAAHFPFWYEPAPLACYRVHEHRETTRLCRSEADLDDSRRARQLILRYVPPASRPAVERRGELWFAKYLLHKAYSRLAAEDYRAGLDLLHEACRLDPAIRFSRARLGYYRRVLTGLVRRAGEWAADPVYQTGSSAK